jgi:hypothetical protein
MQAAGRVGGRGAQGHFGEIRCLGYTADAQGQRETNNTKQFFHKRAPVVTKLFP